MKKWQVIDVIKDKGFLFKKRENAEKYAEEIKGILNELTFINGQLVQVEFLKDYVDED